MKRVILTQARGFFVGMVVSLMLFQQPAQAQFGIVHDPKTFALLLQKKIKEAQDWLETVKFYTDMGLKVGRAVTSLGGILSLAEETLARDDETRKTLSELGRTIRATFALKREIEFLVSSRMAGLKNIESRFRSGIFDAGANMRDLEEYLTHRLGKISDNIQAKWERLAKADSELQGWIEEIQRIEAELATYHKQQNTAEGDLRMEIKKPPAAQTKELILSLEETIRHCETQVRALQSRHSELLGKAAERAERYHVELNYRRAGTDREKRYGTSLKRFYEAREEFFRKQLEANEN